MDISVVIPLYNKRDCITRAIRSIERQTWQPKEIVVVDDGSTDDSAAIVASLGIEKLRLVRKKNGGVSSARNTGVQEACSTWVAFLDADDEWMPEFLSTMKRMHERFPDREVYASAYYLGNHAGDKRKIGLHGIPFSEAEGILENYFDVAAMSAPPLCSSVVCIRRDALIEIGGFPLDIKSGEDLLTWARLASRKPPAYSTEPLAVFWQEKAHTYDDRPNRVPETGDPVGKALLELKKRTGHRMKMDNYLSHWHKMRASIYLRLNMRLPALTECFKGISYRPGNLRLYVYLVMSLLPDRVVMALFKRLAEKVSS